MTDKSWIAEHTTYLKARTGTYAQRCQRYMAAADVLSREGLGDTDTLCDVGAGWTELDAFLRVTLNWRGRYWPVDAALDGTDLDRWNPPQGAEWFVVLEVLEHLDHPHSLLRALTRAATKGVILSTPNPRTVDVLAIDPTHKTAIFPTILGDYGFHVTERSFFGSDDDSLFAWWTVPRGR